MLDIKAIDEICEKNNFYDKIDETMWSDGAGIMISQSTPEGEDWSENFNWDNDNIQVFIDSLKSRIDGWDSEEEAMPYIEMRGQRGVPSSIRDLLDDADWKLEQLKALYTDLINYDANNNYKSVEKKTEALDYVKAAKQINDISTEEIVGYLVKNKDCDARLKDIWEKYLALNKLNVALDDDKYIELDNAAEKIIEELSGLDLLEIDESKQLEKKTEARLTDYLGIMEIRDILQQNPATADKEFAILDNMKVEVGVGDDVKTYKAIKNDEGNWELLEESKHIKTESASYNDFVKAGESLWGEDCSVYDTVIDGIFDCSTAGHGGYLVDTTIFPELAKYGEESSVANIVGFEEDYEALKVLWVFPQLIKSEDFKNKLNLDMVLAYDEDKSFAKEFPTMGGNIVMNENKLEEKTNPYTFEAGYYEWLLRKNGKIIKSFGDITENLPEVCNRKNLMDFAEELVYLSDLDTDTDNIAEAIFDGLYSVYGEDLQESKKCVKEEKTKLNFIENVDELPDMCYGVLPSDNSIIIIKKGERGYFLTNKDYERAYANIIDWNLRNDKANEICDKLNAELGVTPDQRFTMEIRSMNGNWGNKKAEESKKLQEEISDEVAEVAEKIAKKIEQVGIMNFQDIDNMAMDLLGIKDADTYFEKELDNDIRVCLNYKGISNNWGNGDFFTQEYAEKHPEVLEESKSIKTESESEYRAVKIIDASEPGVDYGIIMLNKKHSVQDFQNAMWDAYKRNEEQIQEYGDDLSVVLGDIDPAFDWYEIDMDEECLTI